MDFETPYSFTMQMWSAIAADIIQLATAALVLPILFLRKILAVPEKKGLDGFLNPWLYLSWILLFLTIGTGVFYRTANTCLIGRELTGLGGYSCSGQPQLIFGAFALLFILGIGSFALGVLVSLRESRDE